MVFVCRSAGFSKSAKAVRNSPLQVLSNHKSLSHWARRPSNRTASILGLRESLGKLMRTIASLIGEYMQRCRSELGALILFSTAQQPLRPRATTSLQIRNCLSGFKGSVWKFVLSVSSRIDDDLDPLQPLVDQTLPTLSHSPFLPQAGPVAQEPRNYEGLIFQSAVRTLSACSGSTTHRLR